MAKPRIFVSSTYIDLKHARKHIEGFIKSMGYETVLFESGDITFHHDIVLDESCYAEIETCHMLILIIGGKYGSSASEHEDDAEAIKNKEILFYNSITKNEYIAARQKNIPIFIFVEKGVYSEYQTFKKNRDNDTTQYAHVDNVNIFRLLDDILSQRTNNYIKPFENFEDITIWLKDQWAGMFADFLSKKTTDINIKTLQQQIAELSEISQSLKTYNEAILKSFTEVDSEGIIKKVDDKLKHRKAQRFVKNPMIRYIIKTKSLDTASDVIYTYFSETADLNSFLKKLGFSTTDINRMMEVGPAKLDYLKLRNEFLDENHDLELEE